MGDNHQAGAHFPIQGQHQFEHVVARFAVEIARGFVSQNDSRLRHKRSRHRDPLTLTPGQFARPVLKPASETHALKDLAGPGPDGIEWLSPYQQRHGNILEGGELRQKVMKLVDEAQMPVTDAATLRIACCRHVLAADQHLAERGRVEPAEELEQSGLAGPGGAHDRDPLAGGNDEIDALENFQNCGALGK